MMDHGKITSNAWLQAYHDGEVAQLDRARIEAHLAECAACRAELQAIEALSLLLQVAPPLEERLGEDRFVAQVGLRIVRRPAPSSAQRALAVGWRMAPALLVAAYLFLQVAAMLAGSILALRSVGIGEEAFAMLVPQRPEPGIAADVVGVLSSLGLGSIGQITTVLASHPLIGPVGALNFALTLLIGLGLWSWLVVWRARQRVMKGER